MRSLTVKETALGLRSGSLASKGETTRSSCASKMWVSRLIEEIFCAKDAAEASYFTATTTRVKSSCELRKKKVAPCWESVRARRQGWFVRCEPLPGWLKEFQPHGIGMVWKGSAINNMRARTDSAAEESNENVLIGRPGIVGQNARAVRAEVDRRGNLMAGIFETLKFDHHLLRNAALAAERRESVYHGLLAPFSL
jgi:hypothetical protein